MTCATRLAKLTRLRNLPRAGLVAVASLLALAAPGPAEACRLALVLALDVSGSVSVAEDGFQRAGIAAALLAPEVRQAFLSGEEVAVYAFEWAGISAQVPILPGWVIIRDEADLVRLAGVIASGGAEGLRGSGALRDGTAVGSALVHAAAAFAAGPDCIARTVNISGDGKNSVGINPATVIDRLYGDITVNALVIDRPIEDPMLEIQHGGEQDLVTWFEETVVHGPGSFAIKADSYDDYQQAMTTKLVREVQQVYVSALPGTVQGG